MNDISKMSELEDKLEYHFINRDILRTALSHSSYINEIRHSKAQDYERLEFLGDAVLELTVSDHLYKTMTNMREGEMTKLRASLVCEPTLAACAREELSLGDYIFLGKGEDRTGGRERDSIVSDVFEAMIGAVYLDGGFEEARRLIQKYVLDDMEHRIEFMDSKTRLQEIAQEKGYKLEYVLYDVSGPDHDRQYTMAVLLDGVQRTLGVDKTKKGAEQKAAYAILQALKESD